MYNIIRCYGGVLNLTRAEVFHLIFIIGRMYSVYRTQKMPLTCQEYDEIQIAATLLLEYEKTVYCDTKQQQHHGSL